MGRLGKWFALVLPALVATGAAGAVTDADAARGIDPTVDLGSHEAMARFLLENPEVDESLFDHAGLTPDAATGPAGASILLANMPCAPTDTACVL